MENFLSRLNRNPYAPIDGASVTKFDELGNGLDDWGNVIAPRFEAPEQTWGETALGVLTAPQRLAGALYDSLTPYQFPQTTSTPMNRAGAGQPITGGDPTGGGWQVPPIIGEGVNALTAVGDAYTQGMSEDEMRNRALGMAGFMMGGGGVAAGRAPMLAANASKEGALPAIASALDMSPEARLARAREMGFDTSRTLYHGTDRDFESFNPSQSGAYGPGVYVTPDADYANRYAIGRSGCEQETLIMPLHVRGDMADGMLYESLKREARASGVPDDQIAMAVQQQLQDMGYAGVEGRANQAVTVFDPSNIRSVNAAFDPAKSDSANLLAANADSKPALLAGMAGQEQNVPDWLLPFLQGM